MYLHIGNGKNVRYSDIIGVFDLDNATVSQITKQYLKTAEKKNMTESVCEDVPRSFIVTNEKVFISQISSAALVGRTKE